MAGPYPRISHGSPGNDSSSTDAVNVINALEAGLETVESTLWQVTKSGVWTTGDHGNTTTAALPADGQLLGMAYPVTQAHTLDRIGIEITGSGSSGALVRLGIYKAAANGADYTLVLDAGTVDGTQTAGFYALTISQALTPGFHLLCAASQGAPVTRATLRASGSAGGATHMLSSSTQALVTSGFQPAALSTTGQTGALTGPITPTRYGTAPIIAVRIA